MCNLSKGVEEMGIQKGGIREVISMGRDYHVPEKEILTRLKTKYLLTENEALKYMSELK